MKKYIAILREPDGRREQHSDDEIKKHQLNWKSWLEKWRQAGKLIDGSGLTLNARIVYNADLIENKIHQNTTEIIGGFLLIKAENIDDAAAMIKTCPVYEFNGYAEIRELQNQD
jgi:hypothetical protein